MLPTVATQAARNSRGSSGGRSSAGARVLPIATEAIPASIPPIRVLDITLILGFPPRDGGDSSRRSSAPHQAGDHLRSADDSGQDRRDSPRPLRVARPGRLGDRLIPVGMAWMPAGPGV